MSALLEGYEAGTLIGEVRAMLCECGLGQEVISAFDTDVTLQAALGKGNEYHRFALNHFLTLQLLKSGVPSMDERYCLIPNGDIADWKRLFSSKILPFMITHRLPKI